MRVGWIGRGGRSPQTIATIAARDGLSLNGTAPVKAFAQDITICRMLAPGRLFATNLNCDHRKRENIRFLAICPPIIQDLWCNPSYRIRVLSDHGETKVGDPCATGGVHKDVRLAMRQCVMKRDLVQSLTPLRPP